MKPNETKWPWRRAILLIMPFLFVMSGHTNADPLGTEQATAGGPATEAKKWHWQAQPEAYAPDGLSDYSGDFTASGTQIASPDTQPAPVPRRAAASMSGTGLSR